MNTTKEMRKEEASRRLNVLRRLGLMGCVTRKFNKKQSELYYSERMHGLGILYFFNDMGGAKQEWINLVNDFEQEHNATVYHITHERINGDETLTLFYVGNNSEEWEYDISDMQENTALAYVINLSDRQCSEFGYVGFNVSGGGLVRTY